MGKMIQEFKDFAMKGNVVDMAIGVVIGGAFGNIVTSIVNDIFTPLIACVFGDVDFTHLAIHLRGEGENAVTLNYGNFIQVTETKVAKLKKDDPYGFGITLLSMGIVFSCLALLFVFFTLFGIFMKNKKRIREMLGLSRTQKKKIVGLDEEDARAFPNKSLERSKTYDRDIYIAVISMALKQYSDDVHDTESGVITIRPHNSKWHSV